MSGDPFGIREGEIAAPLPASTDAGLYFIGRIRTPGSGGRTVRKMPRNPMPSAKSRSIRFGHRPWPGSRPCSHLIVLYWMDKGRRDLVVQVPRHHGQGRGTFALRSPVRPNPIAMSVVRLVGLEGTTLSVVGLDCLDNTPLLDLKPYFASTDAVPDAKVGWHEGRD
jgi:tRNA (Thr-GGU) A37 N-methylase